MGGFHLFEHNSRGTSNSNRNMSREDDKPLHPLQEKDLQKCDDYSELFYIPTKSEIKDRGKSDWLAKSLVLLQTSWFVMQCIARTIEHLPVTHLEIVTLAYAAMNFVIYIFWWNKPLNVNQPVRIFKKSGSRETQPPVNELIPEIRSIRKLTWKAVGKDLETISTLIVGGQIDEDIDLRHEDRVPRFWSDTTNDDVITAHIIMLGVGVCFGAIHCIAWHFSFPTHTELLIWRISSVAITALPIYHTGKFDLETRFILEFVGNSNRLRRDFATKEMTILHRNQVCRVIYTQSKDIPYCSSLIVKQSPALYGNFHVKQKFGWTSEIYVTYRPLQ